MTTGASHWPLINQEVDIIELPKLAGRFYKCIFDHEECKYDAGKPHKHKILKAILIMPSVWEHCKDHACYGIALDVEKIPGTVFTGNYKPENIW